jgi:hypothetical protein
MSATQSLEFVITNSDKPVSADNLITSYSMDLVRLSVRLGQTDVTPNTHFIASVEKPAGVGFGLLGPWFHSTLLPGIGKGSFQYEDGGQLVTSKPLWAFAVPTGFLEQSSGGGPFRHLLIHAPDDNLYLLGSGQTKWPQEPFISMADARALFGDDPGFAPQFSFENQGVIQANLPGSFVDGQGRHHSFHVLHLSNMRSLLRNSDSPYKKLLLRGTDGQFYSFESDTWPLTPVGKDDEPLLPPGIGEGSHIIRAEVVSKRAKDADKCFLLDLNGLMRLIQPGQKTFVVSKPKDAPSSADNEYFHVAPEASSPPGFESYTFSGNNPLGKPSDGGATHFLATVVRETDSSGQPRDTFFFHLKSFVDSVAQWNPTITDDQDLLIRVAGPASDSKSSYFYDFTGGTLHAPLAEADRTQKVHSKLSSYFLAQGATIGNITDLNSTWNFVSQSSQLMAGQGTKAEAGSDEAIISCYLLDLQSLRGGS